MPKSLKRLLSVLGLATLLLGLTFGLYFLLIAPPHLQANVLIYTFLIVVVALGTLCLLSMLLLARKSRRLFEASRSWPVVEGVVTKSTTCQLTDFEGKLFKIYYQPQLTYDYMVNGQTYTSDRLRWDEAWFRTQAGAEQFSADYPPGTKVSVYYDPAKPELAVLNPHSGQANDLIGYSLGCLAVTILAAFALFSIIIAR
jgi:hypothetical protein